MKRRLVAGAGQVLAWLVIAASLGAITLAVVVPRIGGATPYTVLGESMEPTMRPGTMAVVRPVDVEDIEAGSVITYQVESGKPAVATHRVVGIGADLRGQPVFQTQGDANDAMDPTVVRPMQVRGEVWYAVPYVGYVSELLNGSERAALTTGVALCLFAYALLMFAGALRERRTPVGTAP
jgi:signal peptidase I